MSRNKTAASESADASSPAVLRGMNLDEMKRLMERLGLPAFRAKQLYHWVFAKGAPDFGRMLNLPKDLKEKLTEAGVRVGRTRIVEAQGPEDGTRKVVYELEDGRFIESVLMRDEGTGRTSVCVSSQVGCAVGCTFCLTGFGGFQRQLAPDEITGQILDIRNELLAEGETIHGFVFMGMGEPMLNVPNVVRSIRLMTDPDGMAISARRITVSTSGILDGMKEFGRAATGVNLAVSLNATTDERRTMIMPHNKRWPIRQLIEACAEYPAKHRQRVTMEYVLLRGFNDTPEDARRLAALLRPLRCKVNVIMFNPHKDLEFRPATDDALNRFVGVLAEADYTVSVRWSKGREIEAACGQLAAHHFRRAAPTTSDTAV